MVDRCRATTKEGKPCAAKPRPGTELCPWHSPDLAERRAEWSARGGANRSNQARAKKQLPADLMTAEEVQSYLGLVFKGLIGGKIEPGVGNAASNVARAMMDVAKAAELEEQVAQLRRDMAAFAERRGAS